MLFIDVRYEWEKRKRSLTAEEIDFDIDKWLEEEEQNEDLLMNGEENGKMYLYFCFNIYINVPQCFFHKYCINVHTT